MDATGEAEVLPATTGWALIRRCMREQWFGLLLGIAAGLVWTAAKVSVPKLVEQAIDVGIVPRDSDAVLRYSVLIGIAAIVAATFTGIRRYLAFREARLAEARLRDELFARLQSMHFAFHDGQQTGELMSRANTDLQQIQNFIVLIPLTISNAVTVFAAAVILVRIDPLLTVLALGLLPLVNVLAKRFSTRLHPTVMAIQQESAQLAAVVEESVSGVRVVKGFGAEHAREKALEREADDVYDAAMAGARVRANYWPMLELLPTIGLIAVLGVGGLRVINGDLEIGSLVAFNAYVVLMIWPLRMLGMIVAMGQRAAASGARVHEILDSEPGIVDPACPVALPDGEARGALRFDDVTFGYLDSRPVLDGFELDVAAGESIALVGATASGKSTVAKLIPRFYDVTAGSVTIDGVDVRDARVSDVRGAVGLVFEDTFLFSDTIAANIAFADPDASIEDVISAARLAGIDEFVRTLPDGYDTELGERGYSLSGGQRQRIAIARAIVADPRILVLDDATSAVDPTKEHEIRDALAEVMRGRTTIVIAHRPATIALADRVALVDEGRVLAVGTHAELLAGNERYREVLASAERESVDASEQEPAL